MIFLLKYNYILFFISFDLDHDYGDCLSTCIYYKQNLDPFRNRFTYSFTCNTFLVDLYDEKYPLTLFLPCGNYFLHHMLLMGIILQPFPLKSSGCVINRNYFKNQIYISAQREVKLRFNKHVHLYHYIDMTWWQSSFHFVSKINSCIS